MNTRRLATFLLLALLVAAVPAAAEDPPLQPDYSREALLVMYGDFYRTPLSADWKIPIGRSRIHLYFLPVVLPLFFDAPRGNLMPPVVPSALLNVSFPATKGMYALDDRDVAKAIRQIEKRRAREARFRE